MAQSEQERITEWYARYGNATSLEEIVRLSQGKINYSEQATADRKHMREHMNRIRLQQLQESKS